MSGRTFRRLRIIGLLFVLFFVSADAMLSKMRSTDWDRSLWVVIYPINGDSSNISSSYIRHLEPATFRPISHFLSREMKRYGRLLNSPIKFKLHPEVTELPPRPPEDGAVLKVVLWSLRLRYWAYRMGRLDDGLPEDIRIFVLYHDPATHNRLGHSLGLEKGLIGVVNAYSSHGMGARNNVVIAHELLHTVGASDKYSPANGVPIFPAGYAEPDRKPLYPQSLAEIMGGRVPLTKDKAKMPAGLKYCVVGEITAREIRWID